MLRTALVDIQTREAILAARIMRDGELSLVLYVSDEAIVTRLSSGLPRASVDRIAAELEAHALAVGANYDGWDVSPADSTRDP